VIKEEGENESINKEGTARDSLHFS